MTSTTTAGTVRPQRNIPAEIARSWLLVNAMKTELFDQSAVSR
ncbi:MAG TPA: CoA ester lyase, partial [Arthrobacter sp.]|nr:CoA ester lyase [Arthrobacter sp.]